MHGRIVDGSLLQPVGAIPSAIHNLCILLGNQLGPVVGTHTLYLVGLIVNLHILLGIQRSNTIGVRILPSHITIEGYLHLATLTLLGGYQNNTV